MTQKWNRFYSDKKNIFLNGSNHRKSGHEQSNLSPDPPPPRKIYVISYNGLTHNENCITK